MSADHTNEMTVLNNSQKPGKRETLLPVSSVFQFQGTGKLLGQLGPAEQPCVAWGAWFSLSFCTHCKGMKHCQRKPAWKQELRYTQKTVSRKSTKFNKATQDVWVLGPGNAVNQQRKVFNVVQAML